MSKALSTNQNTRRILASGETVSNNTWETGLNNNDLVIGSSGAGKTRNYVKPNLLQANESFIVTDTKGLLFWETAPALRKKGYRVIFMDFTEPALSCGYNPLDYIRYDRRTGSYNEQDVLKIAEALCPVEDETEPFWDHAARMYMEAMIGYVLECMPASEMTLGSVLKLLSGAGTSTAKRFAEHAKECPDSFAARKYLSLRQTKGAPRMHASILGILAEKLDPLTSSDVLRMYRKPCRIQFRDIAKRKTAVFVTVSDTDRSLDQLVSLFYTQALQELCSYADKKGISGTLPVPVRLYLDDFATNCVIPDFDNIISVIRSRGISVSVILQSLTQLSAIYGENKACTIVNNCDHLLYLGGQDLKTVEYVSLRAGKTRDTIMNLEPGSGYLFGRGQKPKLVTPYALGAEAEPAPEETDGYTDEYSEEILL